MNPHTPKSGTATKKHNWQLYNRLGRIGNVKKSELKQRYSKEEILPSEIVDKIMLRNRPR